MQRNRALRLPALLGIARLRNLQRLRRRGAYTPVGDQHFKTKSVRLLRALAAEWQVTGQPSVFFRFEGGMGVVLAKARTEAAGPF